MPQSWYEVKPFFARVDEKYVDMHEIVKKIREFSFFIVKDTDMTRLFLQTSEIEAKVVQGALKNALLEDAIGQKTKAFSASKVAYLKMRHHYAVPIVHELAPSLIYATIEKMGKPCFIAVTAKHSDESYQISQFIEKNTYHKSWTKEYFGNSSSSSSSRQLQLPKRLTSPKKMMIAELAKEKQKLRHFHCTLAIGAKDTGTIRSIVKVLSDDGFTIARVEKDTIYRDKVKKPLFFAGNFCVLSDIELANIIALPENPRVYRLGISRVETRTSGPSRTNTIKHEDGMTSTTMPMQQEAIVATAVTEKSKEEEQEIITQNDYGNDIITHSRILDSIQCPACQGLNTIVIQFTEDRNVILPDKTILAVVAGKIYTQCTDCMRIEPYEPVIQQDRGH